MMISAAQLRAARGLLDWTRSELAKASGLSAETIKNIEHGVYAPQESTIAAIVNCFRDKSIEFIENDGVRKNSGSVRIYHGSQGFKEFMDDVYFVAKESANRDKPICISHVDDRLFINHLGDYFFFHGKRMNELSNIKVRLLIQDRPFFKVPGENPKDNYREYRHHPQQDVANVPFYVFGDKLAIMIFEDEKEPQIVVVSSNLVAKAYREQFEVLWKTAVPLDVQNVEQDNMPTVKSHGDRS